MKKETICRRHPPGPSAPPVLENPPPLVGFSIKTGFPEGPARHLDASRQKMTPHCLAAILDSQLPSPKLSLKMLPKLPLPHNRGHFFLLQNCPRGEGNCAAIERQKLSRGNFCLAASRCLSGPSGFSIKADPPPPPAPRTPPSPSPSTKKIESIRSVHQEGHQKP